MKILESKTIEASVMVEALNLLFDVYSDCAFDYDFPVFVQGGFLNGLKQVVPRVRSMVSLLFFFFFFLPHTQLFFFSIL
jgi:hypothetical protein